MATDDTEETDHYEPRPRVRGRGAPREPRILADPITRECFLDKLQETGKKNLAAHAIGTTMRTVNRYLDDYDPEGNFQRDVELAMAIRGDDYVFTIEDQAVHGTEDTTYGRDGERTVRRRFESGLRAKVLERYDEKYRPHSTVEVTGKAGVLAVPMVAASVEEWEANAAKAIEKHGQ